MRCRLASNQLDLSLGNHEGDNGVGLGIFDIPILNIDIGATGISCRLRRSTIDDGPESSRSEIDCQSLRPREVVLRLRELWDTGRRHLEGRRARGNRRSGGHIFRSVCKVFRNGRSEIRTVCPKKYQFNFDKNRAEEQEKV